MEAITKLRALEKCEQLWTWLADNPNESKFAWPGWEDDLEFAIAACPCCQYVNQQFPHSFLPGPCSKGERPEWLAVCPLKSLWPKGCCNGNTVFTAWTDSGEVGKSPNEERRKEMALIIAAASKQARIVEIANQQVSDRVSGEPTEI
jgi:hypothetical protein